VNRGGSLDITLGQIVYSKAGRDKGRKFVIVKDIDVSYVLVSDGDLRKVEKPKKKKIKHLELTETVIETISEKLRNNIRVTNSEIRKALDTLVDSIGDTC
jgi:ribosomal protein L14E/L6E/L27E